MAENLVRLGGTFQFTIPANGVEAIVMEGRYVRCLATTDTFTITIGGDGEGIEFKRGRWIMLPDGVVNFQRFVMRNDTGTAITCTLYVGFGTVGDDITALEGSISTPNTVDSIAQVTINNATQDDYNADLTRRVVVISTASTNAGSLYFRDQSGTGDEGFPLPPGSTISIDTSGAFRIVNNTGSNCVYDVCYLKET